MEIPIRRAGLPPRRSARSLRPVSILFQDAEPEVRDAGCLYHPRALQLDRPGAEAVEEPDAPSEQDGHQVHAHLVDGACSDGLLGDVGAAHPYVLVVGDDGPRPLSSFFDAVRDEG